MILLATALYAVTPSAADAVAKPKITKVSPKTGSTKGGTTVTITGSGFVKVKKVTVGGVKATKVKVLSSKKLRFRTPAHAAGKVTITITTAKGKVTKKSAFTYKKPATPTPTPVPPPTNTLTRSGPITATSGQTITGLHITSTTGPCVKVAPGASNVKIVGNEIGPCGSGVDDVGVLVQAKATRVTISANTIHNVASGALMADAYNPLVFSYNTVYDVRGPFPRGQMVQFAGVSGSAGQSKIIGNVSDKQRATIKTTYEDHINLYKTYGSQAYPILIACNKIRGSATANDLTTGETTSNGSGITIGDNNGAWVDVRNNVVVYTPNTGIGIAGGDHMTIANNLIYNRGTAAGSMTQEAVTVFPYLGFMPTNATITGNRGTARAWKYGSTGQVVDGYWADSSVTGVTLSGNNFNDGSLTDQIWNTTPTCP
ncbi:MAG: IPT/TIG domain-containing protein [Propionibacteriales bacterium]|nr:IPT/TIG domain-containing protein [Propionibacteriales bacterium]